MADIVAGDAAGTAPGTAPPSEGAEGSTGDGWKAPVTLLLAVAIALLVAFVVFEALAFAQATDPGVSEETWTRVTFVLGGLEAIVFTAVGWLFGREVHRGEAREARREAGIADARADTSRNEAERARSEASDLRTQERAARDRAADAELRGWRLAEFVRGRPASSDDEAAPRPDPSPDPGPITRSAGGGWGQGVSFGVLGGEEGVAEAPSANVPRGAARGPADPVRDPVRELADDLFPRSGGSAPNRAG